ncbi:hypothetical protein DXG01_011720, partial [Tephrocybe rancida]
HLQERVNPPRHHTTQNEYYTTWNDRDSHTRNEVSRYYTMQNDHDSHTRFPHPRAPTTAPQPPPRHITHHTTRKEAHAG